MTVLPMTANPERSRWLSERQKTIGASEVAAVLGLDPYKGPVAVFASKIGAYELEDNYVLRRGRLHETAIGEEYASETGRKVESLGAYTIQRHPTIPFLSATLDAVISGSEQTPAPAEGKGTLQIKLGLGSAKDWKEGIPDHYRVQVQVEMACFGAKWGAITALTGPGPLYCEDVLPDPDFWAAAVPVLERFWHDTLKGKPPDKADALPSTSDALKALYSEVPGTKVMLGEEDEKLAQEWKEQKAIAKEAEERARKAQNQIILHMRESSVGQLPGGGVLTLSTTRVPAAVREVKGYEYRVLRMRK